MIDSSTQEMKFGPENEIYEAFYDIIPNVQRQAKSATPKNLRQLSCSSQ